MFFSHILYSLTVHVSIYVAMAVCVCVCVCVCLTPNPSSSNSSLLRHLKTNPGSSKPIHLQCISLITTSGLDWCLRVCACTRALNKRTITDDTKVALCSTCKSSGSIFVTCVLMTCVRLERVGKKDLNNRKLNSVWSWGCSWVKTFSTGVIAQGCVCGMMKAEEKEEGWAW